MLEVIGGFINADNPTWEGTATELIEKLELNIKPNALSLKLNVNAGKLYNLYFVQYSNKRTHKAKLIQLRYDVDHPIVISPEPAEETEKVQIVFLPLRENSSSAPTRSMILQARTMTELIRR